MFEKVLRFFVENSRMNYTLFVMIFAIGIWSYNNTAKEIFPSFELDMISINGSYTGASVDILDKMAVIEIEDNIKSIEGVDVVSTVISPSRFSIVIELKKGYNKYNISNKVKDAVSLIKGNLPSDMDEPNVNVLQRTKDLIDISLTSSSLSTDQMKPLATKVKSKLLAIEGVSDAVIYGDSDQYFEVLLDEKKIDSLGLNQNAVASAIATLSYIFPIGTIKDTKKHYYISTYNGAKISSDFANTLIKVGNKKLYLSDIAAISKKYEDSSTLYSFNGKSALSITVRQQSTGNAIKISEKLAKVIEDANKENDQLTIAISDDNSQRIKERLNIVVSNIMLGIILITILVVLLINWRMSFIIALGIPTSFVIAAIYLYFSGYTVNMISLVGVLIALGIVVDDAIVVSENIQQHIEEGYTPKEAAITGAVEMIKPVSIASLTTLFSFLPILMLSGTMGEIMKLIPIALCALVLASLVESFLFLPIHAAHTLKNGAKVTSWDKVNGYYSKVIHFFMRWKKTFLVVFVVIVPLLIVVSLKTSKFQMFPKFDSTDVKISMKANKNTTLDDAFTIVQSIEKDLIVHKDKYFIKSIDSVAGYRRDSGNSSENYPYVMYMTVELKNLKADNIIDKYITPYLSFYYDDSNRERTQKSQEISKRLQEFLDEKNYIQKFNLEELSVLEKKVGPIKSDIKIGLVSSNNNKIIQYIDLLSKELKKIDGITTLSNTVKFGVDEIKLKVNDYGESLGIDESYIGKYLSNMYMLKKVAVSFDDESLLDIKIQSKNKDDFENFQNSEIYLPDGTRVRLNEVCEFNVKKSLEKLIKDNGEINFYVFANVNPDIITASEVLAKIDSTLTLIEEDNVKVILKGEAQKNAELKNDMMLASALAIVLIMLAMLYLFNSFRETFILMSVIPFSLLGVLVGHKIMGINLSMPALIGALGLAGVVINDGIIMMTYIKKAKTIDELFYRTIKRFRPIIITTVTTLVGMSSLIFFASGQAVIFQPIAIALGFGLAWGTVLNLIYLPVLYSFAHKIK